VARLATEGVLQGVGTYDQIQRTRGASAEAALRDARELQRIQLEQERNRILADTDPDASRRFGEKKTLTAIQAGLLPKGEEGEYVISPAERAGGGRPAPLVEASRARDEAIIARSRLPPAQKRFLGQRVVMGMTTEEDEALLASLAQREEAAAQLIEGGGFGEEAAAKYPGYEPEVQAQLGAAAMRPGGLARQLGELEPGDPEFRMKVAKMLAMAYTTGPEVFKETSMALREAGLLPEGELDPTIERGFLGSIFRTGGDLERGRSREAVIRAARKALGSREIPLMRGEPETLTPEVLRRLLRE